MSWHSTSENRCCSRANRREISRTASRVRLTWALLVLAWCSFPVNTQADDGGQYFETNVRPLLIEHCQSCHGAKKQEAGLRLDSRQALLTGGDSGPAILPADPDSSLLIHAVRYTGDTQMPPKGKLPDQQIAVLEQWVKLGAPWPARLEVVGESLAEVQRRHWAFQPMTQPSLPAVEDSNWEATLIDRFILARLEAAGLQPSPAADRRTLIRRVTMDLTGLPPDLAEVDAFVNDPDPLAYEKLVDRLLDAPQYGEQWGRHWLDVARYSDTKGYVYGREERFWVHAPAYRDWVVNAFNTDLRYDQFLLLQIAADQVALPQRDDLAAMGFLTLGRRFLGVTHDIIDDRIDVVARGTMGLTVACARCHDHKYDPIPTADYYSLYGVFLNSTERLEPIAEPAVRDEAYAAFEKELLQRKEKLQSTLLTKRTEAADRVRQRITEYLVAQTELSKYPEEGFDQVLSVTDVIPTFVRRWEAWLAMDDRNQDPIFQPWRQFSSLKPDEFSSRSAEVVRELTENSANLNSRVVEILNPPPESMREVAERYGTLLLAVEQEWKQMCSAAKEAGNPDPTHLSTPAAEALRQVMYGPGSPCLVPNEAIVSTEGYFDSGSVTELWNLQGEVDRWLIRSPLAPAHALTLADRELIRPSRIFRRGNPANRGAEVDRHFVSVVAGPNPAPFQNGSGRLELAKAIIDPANPLTARVWVNRVWQNHFGVGLVKTSSDFGIRAESPSHPELLDWLATRFVNDQWSTKSLHRLIVLSSTYRQRSDGELLSDGKNDSRIALANQLDPENRLLWRMNAHRLSFEEFRDSLLRIAGRLDLTMGGRAADLFAGNGTLHRRRTIYGLIDRQFLAATLRVFDFANPDLHTPLRSETTVPQQALFALNHPFVAQQARGLVERINRELAAENRPVDDQTRIEKLYRVALHRSPSPRQVEAAVAFLQSDQLDPLPQPRPETFAWQYGYGELDEAGKQLKSFRALPHFSGSSWQGGAQWPDPALGWVQLTATGGHPGNDLQHCSIRRWVAPHDGVFSVHSTAIHQVAAGNGVRCTILSSRQGPLLSATVHQRRQEMSVDSLPLKQGDTLDFVVDIHGELNSDQHLWSPVIREIFDGSVAGEGPVPTWEAERDFSGPVTTYLNGLEQLAQILLITNELMFVD